MKFAAIKLTYNDARVSWNQQVPRCSTKKYVEDNGTGPDSKCHYLALTWTLIGYVSCPNAQTLRAYSGCQHSLNRLVLPSRALQCTLIWLRNRVLVPIQTHGDAHVLISFQPTCTEYREHLDGIMHDLREWIFLLGL
jgi:hypothetical protein